MMLVLDFSFDVVVFDACEQSPAARICSRSAPGLELSPGT
jgi:hypothetical protein